MPATLQLAPAPESVATARRWCREVVGPVADEELVDTVALLVSELVSNVVLHAGTVCQLRVSVATELIRVEVVDGSDLLPDGPEASDPLACSGRGLLLVRSLSEAFGVDADPAGGKCVWFEVALAAVPAGASGVDPSPSRRR